MSRGRGGLVGGGCRGREPENAGREEEKRPGTRSDKKKQRIEDENASEQSLRQAAFRKVREEKQKEGEAGQKPPSILWSCTVLLDDGRELKGEITKWH
jgi:hypothetical protein